MSALPLAVGAASSMGALARYGVDRVVTRRYAGGLPWAVFAINISGSFILGLATGLGLRAGAVALTPDQVTVIGVGFAGGYTTFSTWMVETAQLADNRRTRAAAANIIGSVLAGCLAGWAGLVLGHG